VNKFYFYIKGGLICCEEQASGANLTLAYFTNDYEGFRGLGYLVSTNPYHELLFSTTVPSMVQTYLTRVGQRALRGA
jgi:hypothetical protein